MIRITFDEKKLNETLLKVLKEEDFPFELPEFFQFPHGERRLTDRAEILMLAGIAHLKGQYPKKSSVRIENNLQGGTINGLEDKVANNKKEEDYLNMIM